eukprot:1148295-Pelagomonas_calceolata.AAC.3
MKSTIDNASVHICTDNDLEVWEHPIHSTIHSAFVVASHLQVGCHGIFQELAGQKVKDLPHADDYLKETVKGVCV